MRKRDLRAARRDKQEQRDQWVEPSLEELEAFFLPDCSTEALATLEAMPSQCAACAGRPGTEAYTSPVTSKMLADCKRTGFPFMCHLTIQPNGLCTHLCADWVAAAVRRASGDIKGREA